MSSAMAADQEEGSSAARRQARNEAAIASHYTYQTTVLKKADAEMLTREDVQYDLLKLIFDDPTEAFTDQGHILNKNTPALPKRVNFCNLYLNSLLNSNKLSGVIKEKMMESREYAIELAKLVLLVNVGKVNTTMAFWPEMKTATRTYHPVPSLQKVSENGQDAARIKNALKGAFLPSEVSDDRAKRPGDLVQKFHNGERPPCSITNLIFILSTCATEICLIYFDKKDRPFDIVDFFYPIPRSSASRARAFLWLVFRYLEGDEQRNPFDAPELGADRMPPLDPLSEREAAGALNVDTPEELEAAERLKAVRARFLQSLLKEEQTTTINGPHRVPVPGTGSFRASPISVAVDSVVPAKRRARDESLPRSKVSRTPSHTEHDIAPIQPGPGTLVPEVQPPPAIMPRELVVPPLHTVRPVPPVPLLTAPPLQQLGLGEPSPIPQWPESTRSMIMHAWHTNELYDTLTLSDDEDDDIHKRVDYERRLDILNRLRGRPPTPPEVARLEAMTGA